jgi:hypothetical protein
MRALDKHAGIEDLILGNHKIPAMLGVIPEPLMR